MRALYRLLTTEMSDLGWLEWGLVASLLGIAILAVGGSVARYLIASCGG